MQFMGMFGNNKQADILSEYFVCKKNPVTDKFIKTSELKKICDKLHATGQNIVFTYGTFDLIHSGHAAYLLKAKSYGDILIVGIASNKSKQKLRGKGFPLIDQKNRAELIDYFDFVNYTTIVNKQDLIPALRRIKPNVFFTLAVDWRSHLRKNKEEAFVKKVGGKVIKTLKSAPFVSASTIVEHVADLKIKEIVSYFFGKTKIDLSRGDWKKTKWSGLKTEIRSDTLNFGDHSSELDFFSKKDYFGEVISRKNLKKIGNRLHKLKKKIVLSSGACDLVHSGHARFYSKAKSYGDILILAVPSNQVIRKQKGRGRPIVDENSRAELMAFFNFVDYVVIFDDDSVIPLIKDLKPDIFFTVKESWNKVGELSKLDVIKKYGGQVVSVPPQSPKLSSSKLIRKAAGIRVKQIFKEVLKEADRWGSLKD